MLLAELESEVTRCFQELHNINVVRVWPISATFWQGADAEGNVYNLRW